ncbi:beta-lactamase regulator AmpE [Pseudoalteromonas obscura]|uniref:Beta-lactamase regulator AmpE n=1 Tax=Pseudoalteromonas obscura TaxID=3048491 RepID=A0ABT7EL99_9GAMM|nr:beta-lactamase regulator AmpE [Pseudoalteromonas sp. P94(2023)]MDK2595840.1 beta-lactamase regulator AmpE [Pseudoalteromonas sp. P94(2023)]
MILISILLALIIERLGARSTHWQIDYYLSHYQQWSYQQSAVSWLYKSSLGVMLWLTIPALLIAFLYSLFEFVLWQIALNVCILLICFGCAKYRKSYKGYLNALARDDKEAATLYALQMGQTKTEHEPGGETFGQTLAWINFTHYCAVMFWFVLLGAPGAVLYATTRAVVEILKDKVNGEPSISEQNCIEVMSAHTQRFSTLFHFLNWLPARLAGFGYLIIGNFSKGTGSWLKYLLDFQACNRKVVAETALAAEQIEQQYFGCTYEAACMMRLVKRNVLFYLFLVAALTLFAGLS